MPEFNRNSLILILQLVVIQIFIREIYLIASYFAVNHYCKNTILDVNKFKNLISSVI